MYGWLVAIFVLVTKIPATHSWCNLCPAQSSLVTRAREAAKILATLYQSAKLLEVCIYGIKGCHYSNQQSREGSSSIACKPHPERIQTHLSAVRDSKWPPRTMVSTGFPGFSSNRPCQYGW